MIVKTEKTNERTRREVILMSKHSRERKPKFNSTAYYIEEVVRYRSNPPKTSKKAIRQSCLKCSLRS